MLIWYLPDHDWRAGRAGLLKGLEMGLAMGWEILWPLILGFALSGVVQGIGTALYEEIPYDEAGQPLVGTLADYLLPGAAEMPDSRGSCDPIPVCTDYAIRT